MYQQILYYYYMLFSARTKCPVSRFHLFFTEMILKFFIIISENPVIHTSQVELYSDPAICKFK